MTESDKVRIDRWLWAARFFRTRSSAKAAIDGGKVQVDGRRTKPAKEIQRGQTLSIRRSDELFTVVVDELSEQRGPASIAKMLYTETIDSIERRELERSRRRMERAGLRVPDTKPTKRQRRDLQRLKTSRES
jgi:ribosome-associated heat shock protein Hsp15